MKQPPKWVKFVTNSYTREYPGDLWRDFIGICYAVVCVIGYIIHPGDGWWVLLMGGWIIVEIWSNRDKPSEDNR